MLNIWLLFLLLSKPLSIISVFAMQVLASTLIFQNTISNTKFYFEFLSPQRFSFQSISIHRLNLWGLDAIQSVALSPKFLKFWRYLYTIGLSLQNEFWSKTIALLLQKDNFGANNRKSLFLKILSNKIDHMYFEQRICVSQESKSFIILHLFSTILGIFKSA